MIGTLELEPPWAELVRLCCDVLEPVKRDEALGLNRLDSSSDLSWTWKLISLQYLGCFHEFAKHNEALGLNPLDASSVLWCPCGLKKLVFLVVVLALVLDLSKGFLALISS